MAFIRNDIQLLRAIAVISVMFFHFHLFSFDGGYLGVDIFFVISGYLVTTMITKGIASNNFSFIEFYIKRAKRLLPATYSTFFFVFIISVFTLTSKELIDLGNQLIGALTFTSNYFLYFQGTYFGGEAELKPLLHTWSLSLEEQYYFLLPLLLFFIPKKFWSRSALFFIGMSFASAILVRELNPSAAFYFFPFRAWELGIGSLIAVNNFNIKTQFKGFIMSASYALILLLLISPIDLKHPGLDSALICLLTGLIIVCNHTFKQNWLTKFSSFTGDISYSLYLIHWPIYAIFVNIWFDAKISLFTGICMFFISYFLAYLQYRFIENPFRYSTNRISYFTLMKYLMPSFTVALFLPLFNESIKNNDMFVESRQANPGFGYECSFDSSFQVLEKCTSNGNTKVLVWGDSNAMHLIPGLVETNKDLQVIQATKFVCAPFMGLAPMGNTLNTFQNKKWSRSCLDFNESVLEYINDSDDLKLVIISSALVQYLDSRFQIINEDLDTLDYSDTSREEILLKSLVELTEFLKIRGINHLFVGPPPALDFDLGRCFERLKKNLISLGNHHDCKIDYAEIKKAKPRFYDFYAKIAEEKKINFINLDEILVSSEQIIFEEGKNLYIENSHLSNFGSVYVAKRINLKRLTDSRL